jgi:hypothetical protein
MAAGPQTSELRLEGKFAQLVEACFATLRDASSLDCASEGNKLMIKRLFGSPPRGCESLSSLPGVILVS